MGWTRSVVVLAGVLVLAAVAPAMPASWSSLTHYSAVGNEGFSSLGTLTVSSCTHDAIPREWTCRGNYRVDDPMGDVGHDVASIELVNDYRRHSPGDEVGVSTPRGEGAAYLWGTHQQLRVAVFWLGVLVSLAAVGLTFVRRRRFQLAGVGAAVASALLLTPTLTSVW